MNIFENPYLIILMMGLCLILLAAVGAYFAIQGIRAAKGTEVSDFSNINKLESAFGKIGKLSRERSVVYASISLENARRLYSESKARRIFSEIKPILLEHFVAGEDSGIALHDQKNFVALNNWDMKTTERKVEKSRNEINRCLQKFNALNVVDVKFGSYSAAATQVSFDEAMNRAKQACTMAETAKVPYVEWNSSEERRLEKRIKIENIIENAIDNNRFFLEYQPAVYAKTKKIAGAEVLSRLNTKQEGVVEPAGFLSALDSVGINDKFDYYIFEKNCKWISNNKAQREKYDYTINFSRTTICDPEFVGRISEIIEKYNLKYSTLAIEVLEDKEIVGEAKERLIKNLADLRKKGITVLLDDFGSGHALFGDLQSFSVDIVKIDKAITKNTNTETGLVIFKNIVKTAKDIGLKVVCEGIETAEQEKTAIEAGCDILQGFYYYHPMSVTELERLFEQENS